GSAATLRGPRDRRSVQPEDRHVHGHRHCGRGVHSAHLLGWGRWLGWRPDLAAVRYHQPAAGRTDTGDRCGHAHAQGTSVLASADPDGLCALRVHVRAHPAGWTVLQRRQLAAVRPGHYHPGRCGVGDARSDSCYGQNQETRSRTGRRAAAHRRREAARRHSTTLGNIMGWWQRFSAGLKEYYVAPYRRTSARAKRDAEDLFMMLVMSEALGVPNPASGVTLELLPEMLDRMHEWHTRQGLEQSPFDGMSCCRKATRHAARTCQSTQRPVPRRQRWRWKNSDRLGGGPAPSHGWSTCAARLDRPGAQPRPPLGTNRWR